MNTLNNCLNHLFKTKVLKKSDFKRKFFLTDRQLNYFLKTGAPIPDNFLYLLSKNFDLSSEEYEKILEAYEVSKYGEHIVTNKMSIHKLLISFNDFYHYSTLNKSKLNTFPECMYIPIELVEFLDDLMSKSTTLSHKILLSTMQGQEVIELVQYIINELYKHQNKHIKIEHIFNYKNTKKHPNMTHNLDFLCNITSLIASYENYNPYFYTITYTQEDSYNIYPNIILIHNTLIYASEDFKSWFYINNENNSNIDQIVSLYYTEFEKSKICTKPLIRTMKDMASFQEFIINVESTSMIQYGFRKDMSCLAPPSNMSIDWFEYDKNVINENILKILIELHNDRIANFQKKFTKGSKYNLACSRNTIINFLNTGRIYDQGEYPAFNINARIKIILNLIEQLRKNPSFNVYFIKEDLMHCFPFINTVQLCTNDGSIMISITDENKEICEKQPFVFAVLLDSPEISNCFNEYIEIITKTMTYSKDETILIIKNDLDDFALKHNIKIPYI